MKDGLSRRDMLGAGGALVAGLGLTESAQARVDVKSAPSSPDELVPGAEVIELWPGKAPGDTGAAIARRVQATQAGKAPVDRWIRGVARPVLVAIKAARPDGSAALVMPGGGYEMLSFDKEGVTPARWLAARGTHAFVLMYRLPGEGWANRSLVPLQDAQRAMRLIRARAGIDPARVMALGFSAGGHLAGSLATRHAERVYAPIDAADALSARPDLAALIYPVVSMMPGLCHAGSRDLLLGPGASEPALRVASVENRVGAETPPLFLTHALDDAVVPVGGTLTLFEAARAARRVVDLHVVARGGHGFGMELPASESGGLWPQLLARFMKNRD